MYGDAVSEAHVVRADRSGSLEGRLVSLRRLVAEGRVVTFEVAASDVPVAAVVTAAVEAGAAAVVAAGSIAPGDRHGFERDVRRAADVASALVVERGDSGGARR